MSTESSLSTDSRSSGVDSAGSDKQSLRKLLRHNRRSLSTSTQSAAATSLVAQLIGLEEVQQASRIALYLPNDGEIDPSGLIAWCSANARYAYLPIVRQLDGKNSLRFAPVDTSSQLEDNRFGIAEPLVDEADLIDASELDLVLLPLVGFDATGNRIGMGGGFYDRTFEFVDRADANAKPVMIGLAHELQRVDFIDAESWDIPLRTVVTDQAVYRLERINP